MKYKNVIEVLKEKGLKFPTFFTNDSEATDNSKGSVSVHDVEKKLMKLRKYVEEGNLNLSQYYLAISDKDLEYYCVWLEEHIVPYLSKIYESQGEGGPLYLQQDIIEFKRLHKYYLDIDELWINDILHVAREINSDFYSNLKMARAYGLWDLDNYFGKSDEGFSIYLDDQDLTYISVLKEYNKTDKIYLSHEVGHAYYNFVHKKTVKTFSEFVDTEYEATKFSIICMSREDKSIFNDFIASILSDICLKLTNIYLARQLAKKDVNFLETNEKYFRIISRITPWILDSTDYNDSFIKYNWINLVLSNELEEYNLYYFISEIRAIHWGITHNLITEPIMKGKKLWQILGKLEKMF